MLGWLPAKPLAGSPREVGDDKQVSLQRCVSIYDHNGRTDLIKVKVQLSLNYKLLHLPATVAVTIIIFIVSVEGMLRMLLRNTRM